MMRRWLAGKTLAFRLTLFIIIAEALVLTIFSSMIFYSSRSEMIRAFDNGIRAKAESIAALVEIEGEDDHEDELEDGEVEGAVEFEINNGILPGSQSLDGSLPDEFIITVDHDVLATTKKYVDFAEQNLTGSESDPFEFQAKNGTIFRGIDTVQFRPTETMIHTVRVVYASDMTSTNASILSISQKVVGGTLLCLIISAWIVLYLARVMLKPVRDLVKQIEKIGNNFRGRRIDSETLSIDLIPISESINSMIVEIEYAFEREKEFSSDAAHELRSPIASLKSSLQASLLSFNNESSSSMNQSEVYELIESLLDDTERMEKLCEALLLLTVERNEQDQSSLSATDWKQEILTAVECIKGLPSAEKAKFTVTDQLKNSDNIAISIDNNTVFRIVENLLENAIRHGGENVSIEITMMNSADKLSLIIEDDGPGIPMEHHGKIFERFYRVDSSRDRNTGGTGLGLSICQTLATHYGGIILYEPSRLGGCRFRWNLNGITIVNQSSAHEAQLRTEIIQNSARG